jgi:hypothetical protein
MPILMWPTEVRTDWMPCNRRCSNILHTAWTYCHAIFTPFDIKENPQRPYIHVRWRCAGGCGIVIRQQLKEFTANGTHQLMYQWNSCLNACGDVFNCCNTLTHEHYRTGFIWTCLLPHCTLSLTVETHTHWSTATSLKQRTQKKSKLFWFNSHQPQFLIRYVSKPIINKSN